MTRTQGFISVQTPSSDASRASHDLPKGLRRHRGQVSPRQTDSPALSSLTPTEPGGEEAPKAAQELSGQLRVEPEPPDHCWLQAEQAPRFTLFWTDFGSSAPCYLQMGLGEFQRLHSGEDRSEKTPTVLGSNDPELSYQPLSS